MENLYYIAPTDEQFNELKRVAIELWSTMSDEPSYAEGKVKRIKDLENITDNFMYMVAMFDVDNQHKLAQAVSDATRQAVKERLIDGGSDFNPYWE